MKGETKDLGTRSLLLTTISRNPSQPRVTFDEEKIKELADSIQNNGLLQPIVVRKILENTFSIIAGERRFRAHVLLNAETILARVIECDDRTAYELTLLENIVRLDLDLLEEARGYKYLKDTYKYTLDDLTKVSGKSKPSISNICSILSESPKILAYVATGVLTLAAYMWIKQLPNDTEKITILEKLGNEELKRSNIRDYVTKVVLVYKTAEKFNLRPEDLMVRTERKGTGGRFDNQDVFPKDFNFYYIVDVSIENKDLEFLPVKNILMSSYTFMHDKGARKRLALILLERSHLNRLFMDSGVMPAARRKDWKYFSHIEDLLKFYEVVQPDICVSLDVPMYPFVYTNWKITKQEMIDITLANAKKFRDWKPSFKTIKVFPLQGTTKEEYLDCFYRYKALGIYDLEDVGSGFGGMATSGAKEQREVVSYVMAVPEVRETFAKLKLIHGFGIGNPQRIIDLYKLGVNSFDSFTTVIITSVGQYWIRNGKMARHIIHESQLSRKIRLYFNISSFWGQLAQKFADYRGLKLKEEQEDVKLDHLEDYST